MRTPTSTQFGLGLPIVQQVPARAAAWERDAGPAELVQIARAADRLSFAWITCSDHVAVPASYAGAMGPTWYEPVATLAYLAACTTRVRLLSHVLVLPYRHPLLVAKSFATLDRLSGGRVILGVGSGHLKPEFRTLQASFEERGRQTDEAIRAVSSAFENEVSSFAGGFASWRDMMLAPRAAQQPRPQIWVGGNGRAAVRRAVQLADGWIPWELELGAFRDLVNYGRTIGEPREPFAVIAPLSVGHDESSDEVNERVHQWRAAGASGFHVGLGHRSLAHLLERMECFSAEVIGAVD